MPLALACRRRYPLAMLFLSAFVLLAGITLAPRAALARPDAALFPEFPDLKANVDFWETVYTRYTTRQGILHDSRDLSRIYAVIDLRPTTEARNRKHNRRTIKAAKARWAERLRKLAAGGDASGWPDNDLARRLKSELSASDLRKAAEQVRCQIGQADRFRKGLIRSGAYIDQIRAIFKDAGLPQDLAYLPHVESSFNLKAYSKFGAAGIWQFTRSTGRRFMQIGYTVDERRDPIAASHAAARLLTENYAKLGTWPLAITAYNHGAAGMARAKKRHDSFPDIVARYKGRTFKFASRNFYAEFLAARRIADNYEHYFGKLQLDTPEKIHRLPLKNYAAIETVSDHFGIDLATLGQYNPALRPPVFRGQKYIPRGYVLNLPGDSGQLAHAANLDLPARLYHAKQKPSRFYTVQPGDTAGRVARLHGIRLGDLILANNLDRRATIYVNQNLRLPLPGENAVLLAKAKPAVKPTLKPPPAQTLMAKAPSPAPEPADTAASAAAPATASATMPTAVTEPVAEPATEPVTVAVNASAPVAAPPMELAARAEPMVSAEPGEPATETAAAQVAPTVPLAQAPQDSPAVELPVESPLLAGLIPEPFPMTIGHLAEPEVVSVTGRVVLRKTATAKQMPYDMWMFSATPHEVGGESGSPIDLAQGDIETQAPPRDLNLAMVTGHLKVERTSMVDGVQVGYIQVEVEETLGHFADWLEIRTHRLRRLNGFAFGQVLHTHQRIKIPFNKVSRETFEERRFEYHQRIQEDFFVAYQVESLNPYRVKPGDSLWSLAGERFDVPMWLLKRCNPEVDFSALHPNQELRIPVVEKLPDRAAVSSPEPGFGVSPPPGDNWLAKGGQGGDG